MAMANAPHDGRKTGPAQIARAKDRGLSAPNMGRTSQRL